MQADISVQQDDFDIGAEINKLKSRQAGALVSFIGTVRDISDPPCLDGLWLEHYPGMTEREITRITQDALARWPLTAVRVIHRIGRLEPMDNIVFVGTASAHRQAAFEAASFIMDYLKSAAPFWKAEEQDGKRVWVDARESDTEAMTRWQS